jgi:ribosomal protein S18 acetylase RimI-like enzyme
MKPDPLDTPSGADLMVEVEPRPEDVRFLEEGLYEFNTRATGISDGDFLGLFMRAPDGSPVAGVFGWTWGGTCYIRYLFVSENMRRQGRGTLLIRTVETEAISRGCRQIVLETHDFQAPGFYQKLGFTVVGRADNYPRGYQYLMLVKQLV